MISPETVVAVRERANIVALIGENVRLTKAGRSYKGLCPFHKEKTPSFNVNPERGFFHCFGCGESGDAIGYLMKLEGHTFPEAVRALAERLGVPVEETGAGSADLERSERQRREKEGLYALNQITTTFYEQQLGPEGHPLGALARAELERRGLPYQGGGEEIDAARSAFRLGYAPYGWDGLASYLRKQGVSAAAAERLGLVVRRPSGDGHYDAFRHRLVFPVIDRAGRVVAFSARALPEPDAELLQRHGISSMSSRRSADDRGPPKYVNSPESPIYVKGETVFGLHQARRALRERELAVVVEGNFDVVALHARGLTHVVAPLGTAFTTAQARLIKRYAPTLVVLFDGDAAGKKATTALRGPAREAGLALRVAAVPAGSDPDDLARSRGIAAVEAVIDNAKGMLEYLIDDTLGGEDAKGASLQDKHERIQQVLAYISEESDPGLRGMAKAYADRLSSHMVVAGHAPADIRSLERMVASAMRQPERADASEPDNAGPTARSQPRASGIELAVIGALLDYPELLDDPAVEPELAELEGDAALASAAIRQSWDEKKSLVGAELLDLLPQAVHPFAVGRLASPRHADEAEARAVLLDNIEKIRRRALTGDKAVKVQELARAQSQGDIDAEDELLRALARVARRKRGLS